MGLFSFLKDAGAKLFGKKDAPKPAPTPTTNAPSVDEMLKKQKVMLLNGVISNIGIPVNNLQIDLNEDVVTLAGEVDTTSNKEKLILAVGNVNGIAFVDDRMTVLKPEPEATFHVVEKGDTLSKLAQRVYGDPMKYPIIFEANRPMLSDPNEIYPGQTLRVPALDGAPMAAAPQDTIYVVQSGDTLGKIAKHFYGSAGKYMVIFEANKDKMKDPNSVRVGQELTIPNANNVA